MPNTALSKPCIHIRLAHLSGNDPNRPRSVRCNPYTVNLLSFFLTRAFLADEAGKALCVQQADGKHRNHDGYDEQQHSQIAGDECHGDEASYCECKQRRGEKGESDMLETSLQDLRISFVHYEFPFRSL